MRAALIVAAATLSLGSCGNGSPSTPAETYRLVHAIGNTEHVAATGLTRQDCRARQADLKATATALGTFNEKTGYGSITCLPESLFAG